MKDLFLIRLKYIVIEKFESFVCINDVIDIFPMKTFLSSLLVFLMLWLIADLF